VQDVYVYPADNIRAVFDSVSPQTIGRWLSQGEMTMVVAKVQGDERAAATVAFWARARAWLADRGITVRAVLTDNGPAYRSTAFAQACLAARVRHLRTRPYRPQTNGKIERFWRTLDDDVIEGATFDNLDHFANELFEYLIYYNNHRPHQALGGQTPKSFALRKTQSIQSAN